MKINITREQFYNFVKTDKDQDGKISKSTQHYLDYFDKYQETGKKAGWNWAGLLSPFWMYYRKMFLFGIVVAFAMRFFDKMMAKVNNLFQLGSLGDLLDFALSIVIILIFARYADYIYLKYINEKISKGKITGGVSKVALVISLMIFVCYTAFLIMQELKS